MTSSQPQLFQDDVEQAKSPSVKGESLFNVKYRIGGKAAPELSSVSNKTTEKQGRWSLKSRVLSRVFSEDYEMVPKKILDPRGLTIRKWNRIFLGACLFSLFLDPLFFFLPSVDSNNICVYKESTLKVVLTTIRSIADVFYVFQIYVRFRTAYVAPSSRVFGRGELVIDSSKIVNKYLMGGFWMDLIAAFPLPQMLIWLIIPSGSTMETQKNVVLFIIIFQYLPRIYLIFPKTIQIVEASGVVSKTAWAGAAYNMMLYILASHVIGASFYLLTVERQEACWLSQCKTEDPNCRETYFDCKRINDPIRSQWFQSTNVSTQCVPSSGFYEFGIYGGPTALNATSVSYLNKYFYCFWFGMNNLNCLGQNLQTSTYLSEILFAIFIGTLGLVLFSLLIGNVQRYLQSTTVRLEEWRLTRDDTERWMHHRQLPPELRQSVRRYEQYKWAATRGVDEESLLQGLPSDLRRDIKRHLCYDLLRRVPLFDQMDERTLDAICERLKPALCTEGTCPVREGDPVNEMLFIIRGNLDSFTTNGGSVGFFNSCRIGPGDFFGEELLTWALDPHPSVILPTSTRTVMAISEVEAFALIAEDLRFVASQFRRLHSKKLRHTFRFHSHQWRTWAAVSIQAAWRRYKRKKSEGGVEARQSFTTSIYESEGSSAEHAGNVAPVDSVFGAYIAMLNLSGRWKSSSVFASPRKPAEPDFSVDQE